MCFKKNGYLGCAIISLILGSLNYLFFRPDTYISHFTQDVFPFISLVVHGNCPKLLCRFMQSFFSDITWAISLFLVIYLVISTPDYIIAASFICISFEILVELLQLFNVISGTFDIWDILLEGLATILVALFVCIIERKKEKTNNE